MASVATVTITFPSRKQTPGSQVVHTSPTAGGSISTHTSTRVSSTDDSVNPFLDSTHCSRENKSISSTSLQSPLQSQYPFDRVLIPSPRRHTPREPITCFRPSSEVTRFRQEEQVTYKVQVINATIPPLQQDDNDVPPILLHDITAVQPLSVSSEVMLFGHCRVTNLSFEKHVVVRCTMDAWETHSDIKATYHDTVPRGKFDRFSFKLNVDPEKEVQIALRYNVNHQEYWDNNNGENYRLSLKMKSETINVPVEGGGYEEDEEVLGPEDEAASDGQIQ